MPVSINNTTLTFNDGTTMTTAATGGVTSLNGQTGAITNTTLGNIGSVFWAAADTGSALFNGSTIAGSSLRYATTSIASTGSTPYIPRQFFYSSGNGTGTGNPQTTWDSEGAERKDVGNVGKQVLAGSTALSGTWRCMGQIARAVSGYIPPESNTTFSRYKCALFVRVS
jgi:hypothetical protein